MNNFWNHLEAARAGNGPMAPSANPAKLKQVLDKLTVLEVESFCKEFYSKLIELNRWDLWGAGYVITGGMSDDSFHYFRSWIIGKGKECYEVALADPNGLSRFIDDAEVDNELLEYASLQVLESRGSKSDPTSEIAESADDEPKGEAFDEDTVEERFPALVGLS